MNPTTSLLDRANLDRDQVRHEVARGLSGADDGELFLEYGQTEALMFDNGRLKQATSDTSQGFGLRAVKDDAVGYAHSSDVSLPALIPERGRDYSGIRMAPLPCPLCQGRRAQYTITAPPMGTPGHWPSAWSPRRS